MVFEQKYSSTYNRWNTFAFTENIYEHIVNKNRGKKIKMQSLAKVSRSFPLKSLTKITKETMFLIQSEEGKINIYSAIPILINWVMT